MERSLARGTTPVKVWVSLSPLFFLDSPPMQRLDRTGIFANDRDELSNLLSGHRDRIAYDNPLDAFGTGRRGQRAVVGEMVAVGWNDVLGVEGML